MISMRIVVYEAKCPRWSIDLIKKSQNALASYPVMLHSEEKCAHFCSELSIVRYGTDAFCDSWNLSIHYFFRLIKNTAVRMPHSCHPSKPVPTPISLWIFNGSSSYICKIRDVSNGEDGERSSKYSMCSCVAECRPGTKRQIWCPIPCKDTILSVMGIPLWR